MKETSCIRLTQEDARFNRDSGYELLDCWITTLRRLRYQANSDLGVTRPRRNPTPGKTGELMCMFVFSYIYRSVSQDQLQSTLRRTSATWSKRRELSSHRTAIKSYRRRNVFFHHMQATERCLYIHTVSVDTCTM